MTDDKPTEKRTPDHDSPSPQKKKLKSAVVVVPRTNEEVWKELIDHIKDTNYPAED